jgi:hypothetical protein
MIDHDMRYIKFVDVKIFQAELAACVQKINEKSNGNSYSVQLIKKSLINTFLLIKPLQALYEIISMLETSLSYLFPFRFALVNYSLDNESEAQHFSKLSNPSISLVYETLDFVNEKDIWFASDLGDELIDLSLTNQINLLILLKKKWKKETRILCQVYKEKQNQKEAAKAVGISQQAVSKILKQINFKPILVLENNLKAFLEEAEKVLTVSMPADSAFR